MPDTVFRCVEAASAALRVADWSGELPQLDPSLLEPFQDVAGIDSGEAVMFARMLEHPAAILLAASHFYPARPSGISKFRDRVSVGCGLHREPPH